VGGQFLGVPVEASTGNGGAGGAALSGSDDDMLLGCAPRAKDAAVGGTVEAEGGPILSDGEMERAVVDAKNESGPVQQSCQLPDSSAGKQEWRSCHVPGNLFEHGVFVVAAGKNDVCGWEVICQRIEVGGIS